jgi:Domain of unknown function (DUF4278)
MKLTYRGVTYDYNPPKVEYGDRTQVGKYRGVDIRFRNIEKPLVLQPTLDLIYRGVCYTTNQAEAPVAPAAVPVPAVAAAATPAPTVQEQARWLMMSHHRNVKRRQQAMLGRLDQEVGLTASQTNGFWNHIRGTAHPSFNDSYDRSHAAMS